MNDQIINQDAERLLRFIKLNGTSRLASAMRTLDIAPARAKAAAELLVNRGEAELLVCNSSKYIALASNEPDPDAATPGDRFTRALMAFMARQRMGQRFASRR